MLTATDRKMKLLGFKVQGDLGPFTCYTNRKNQLVWYIKAPPIEAPTDQQVLQHNNFAAIGRVWQMLDPDERARWKRMAHRANLRITGYNLFTYWMLSGDIEVMLTISNQVGMSIMLPEPV